MPFYGNDNRVKLDIKGSINLVKSMFLPLNLMMRNKTYTMLDPVETTSVVAGSLVLLAMAGLIAYDSWRNKQYQKKLYGDRFPPYREDETRKAAQA